MVCADAAEAIDNARQSRSILIINTFEMSG